MSSVKVDWYLFANSTKNTNVSHALHSHGILSFTEIWDTSHQQTWTAPLCKLSIP